MSGKNSERWQPYEWQKAKELLARGHSLFAVAQTVNRSRGALADKIRYEKLTQAERDARRERINANRRKTGELLSARATFEVVTTVNRPTPDLLMERDRRMAAPRSLSALLLGDPAPGYSALDRKRQGAQA